jgi:hypothetical protein
MQKRRILAAAFAVSAAMTLMVAGPASASVTNSGSFAATCNPSSYGYGTDNVGYAHVINLGSVLIKQKSSSPGSTSTVTAMSQNGKEFASQNIGDNQTASWSNVLAGTYHVEAKSSYDHNCNGILPGDGNYTFSYEITY